MSYFDYPRLTFSGRFKASPSTINNAPHNFDPGTYPTPNELEQVELYWNPRGDGGFDLVDCVVTRIDYADGSSATTPAQDALIGQPVDSIRSGSFPISAGLVDLDPAQQNVTEIWGLGVRVGGAAAQLSGQFSPIAFTSIWGQAMGPEAPRSSASGSGLYQSTLKALAVTGATGGSAFLQHFADDPGAECSLSFNLNAHNNRPPLFRFATSTFDAMAAASPPVPAGVIAKLQPMAELVQNLNADGTPRGCVRGDVPCEDFVVFMLQQYLTLEEYNASVDQILAITRLPYTKATPEDFLYGQVTGTLGPRLAGEPEHFVANRMLNPPPGSKLFDAPFVVSDGGRTLRLNLGNSLPTENPGSTPWAAQLGTLQVVAFPDGIDAATAVVLGDVPYTDADFITGRAGLLTLSALPIDCSAVPLGLVSQVGDARVVVLAENAEGWYLRADQFVYRMNPGLPTTADFPRGETNSVAIHALKFGQPVPDGTQVSLSLMSEADSIAYTEQTMGTGGTVGIDSMAVPQDALSFNGQSLGAQAPTVGGVARFELAATPPGNPRGYLIGQVYLVRYGFGDPAIAAGYQQNPDEKLSVQVYDATLELSATEVLAKWGRIYKVMDMLTDTAAISQIDRRNMIKLMLQRPFSEREHMPVTRDLGQAAVTKIVDWINDLNNG